MIDEQVVTRYQTPRYRGGDGDDYITELRVGEIQLNAQPSADGQSVTLSVSMPVEVVTYRLHHLEG